MRRRLLMNQARLPSGYERLKYIEGSYGQQIRTGITGYCSWIIDVEGSTESATNTRIILGFSQSSGCWFGYTGLKYSIGGGNTWEDDSYERRNVNISFDSDKHERCSINSIQKERTFAAFPTEILLFGISGYSSDAKMYSAICYQDNNKIREFIPLLRISDNKACLYDIINNALYFNSLGGAFGYEKFDGTYVAPISA